MVFMLIIILARIKVKLNVLITPCPVETCHWKARGKVRRWVTTFEFDGNLLNSCWDRYFSLDQTGRPTGSDSPEASS